MTQKHVFPTLILALALSVPVFAQQTNQTPDTRQGQPQDDRSQDDRGTYGTRQTQGDDTSHSGSTQTGRDAAQNRSGAGDASQDMKFAKSAAMGALTEVKLAELALERASSQSVKDFAQKMQKDHSQASEELKSIAGNKGISLPQELDKKHQKVYNKLSQLSGTEFDAAYMKFMEKDHREDVKQFEKQANKGQDQELREFASKYLPHLREHLQMASNTWDQVQAQARGSERSGETDRETRGSEGTRRTE